MKKLRYKQMEIDICQDSNKSLADELNLQSIKGWTLDRILSIEKYSNSILVLDGHTITTYDCLFKREI